MPATLTYPGVYIEELSSGVHTITGVATSIAAFIGWANQGPIDAAVLVESWSDFQTQYGGLTNYNGTPNYLGYAVNQFFANGGTQAYIIRVAWQGNQGWTAAPGTTMVPCATAAATAFGTGSSVIWAKLNGVSAKTTLAVSTGTLTSIAITPATATIAGNPVNLTAMTQQFTATGTFSDGSTQDVTSSVTWSSGTAATATIGASTGLATGVAAGTSTITASLGAVSTSAALTVTEATLSSIAVTPANPTLPAGLTLQFTAIGTYSDGSTSDLTTTATWASGTAAAATISAGGLATGVAAGSSAITATDGAVSGGTEINVNAAQPATITVTPAFPTLAEGLSLQFKAVGNYPDGSTQDLTNDVTWSSATPGVATIAASGLGSAVAAGTSEITATLGAVAGNTTATVSTATLSSIAITPASPSVAAGATQQLKATGKYSDGSTQDLTMVATWSSTVAAVATVAATGVATALAAGTSAITAAVGAITQSVTLTVAAATLVSIAITPANPTVSAGQTQQFVATGTYSDLTTQVITNTATWSSASSTVATINSSGLATTTGGTGNLALWASNPGVWGNNLLASVTVQAGNTSRFAVTISQVQPSGNVQVLENFVNLSITATDSQYVATILDNDSNYVTLTNPLTGVVTPPTGVPASTTAPLTFSGGADGSVLAPATDGNFEIALGPDPSPTSTNDYGLRLLDRTDIFNLLCIPAETDAPTIQNLQAYCALKRAFYIVDCPETATVAGLNNTGPVGSSQGSLTESSSANSAYYFPWVNAPDPLFGNRPTLFPPCGFVAGIYASTDASRGVWKAPAGIAAGLTGVSGLQFNMTDLENGNLNIQAINCLREFKIYGDVVWGARTLQGNDQAGSQWKYVPIRRLALYLESSLYDGTQWVVFEPNDEPLWGQIRLNVGTFMQGLFLQGAFQGSTPQQAYFVKCDSENNPQSSIDQGIVNILVGFAPLYPAEFVVIQIQQISNI